ncbi:hypothetical protein SCP_0906040 [Sparassis crispa]|uniref:Uncharacterized protein n=1 Tax=Sparassis crispa TaxID=139825 RepID=A0A401GY45_9APHY|nr:hypothetical protein SCP_0906040 [Sparassis crispa]GBE86724.1 hypothetical protein SCP_0906040 [Sparassis crispa]
MDIDCPDFKDLSRLTTFSGMSARRTYIRDLRAAIRDQQRRTAHLETELVRSQTMQSICRAELSKLRRQLGITPDRFSEADIDALEATVRKPHAASPALRDIVGAKFAAPQGDLATARQELALQRRGILSLEQDDDRNIPTCRPQITRILL